MTRQFARGLRPLSREDIANLTGDPDDMPPGDEPPSKPDVARFGLATARQALDECKDRHPSNPSDTDG